MSREASCPSCGAALVFRNAGMLVVCGFCRTAAYRTDVDVESLGKVPEVAEIESAVSLGAEGRLARGPWRVVGQVQLEHGTGPWNEWRLQFDDGRDAWLAEAQGELILTAETEAPPGLSPDGLAPGAEVELRGRRFVVAEVRRARVTSVAGELPARTMPGDERVYADLRGEGGAFASLSYDRGDAEAVEAYLGHVVRAEALGIDASTVQRAAPGRAATDRLACPKCGSPVALRDPEGAVTVTCDACASLLDRTAGGLRVVFALKRLPEPTIPLGTSGHLHGLRFEVIAHLERSVKVSGVRYPWHEYLLRTTAGEYRWLVQSNGHWSFVEPADLATIRTHGGDAECGGRTYRRFQGGAARVDAVQGEMYWQCRVGDEVDCVDYVRLDRRTGDVLQLSREWDGEETTWSRAHYVTVPEMTEAFGGRVGFGSPSGIAINQPNPVAPVARGLWPLCGALAAAVVALWIAFAIHHADRVVLRQDLTARVDPPADAPPEADAQRVTFTDEFTLEPEHANVVVGLRAAVDNSWVGVSGALVELDTGDVREFAVDAESWHGVEDGESWSEGSNEASVYVGSVPAGRYAMRLHAAAWVTATSAVVSIPCQVTVRSQVPSTGRPIGLLLLLGIPPVVASILSVVREGKRWEESDMGSGGVD